MKPAGDKNLDFELNLLPVISVLAVCISFLLLTIVWVRVGTFDLSQALGTEASAVSLEKRPSLWLTLANDGAAQIVIKDAPQLEDGLQLSQIKGVSSHVAIQKMATLVSRIKEKVPNLNTGLVIPASETSYEDLVQVMDQLRKYKIADIGIAPL